MAPTPHLHQSEADPGLIAAHRGHSGEEARAAPEALMPAGMKSISGDGDGDGFLSVWQWQTMDALGHLDAQIQRITPAARAVPPKKLGR